MVYEDDWLFGGRPKRDAFGKYRDLATAPFAGAKDLWTTTAFPVIAPKITPKAIPDPDPAPEVVDIRPTKLISDSDMALLPEAIKITFLRNRVTISDQFEFDSDTHAWLDENCTGFYRLFDEHGPSFLTAIGFESEEDLVLFKMKYQGTQL